MRAAFFYDERFTRDASGTYYSTGTLPYRAFARYLKHFERLVVVARLGRARGATRTVASGDGVDWACIEQEGLAAPRYAAAMARRARELVPQVDAVVVRLPGLAGVLAAREAERVGKPWMAEVVADALETLWNHGSPVAKLAAVPVNLLNRYWIGRARFAVYVTRAKLQRRYPPGGDWVAASNVFIDAPRTDVLQRRLARIEARPKSAPLSIGLVGSYDVRYKGHASALRALATLEKASRPVTLRCIGGGDPGRWRQRAEALGVGAWVDLAPALPQGGPVLGWMDQLDALIVPSDTEGLPRCLIEGMSRALPAIGSTAGGIPELLEPRWMHRPRDHAQLAALLSNLLWDRAEMKEQARRNWQVAGEYAADVLERRRDELVRRFYASALASRVASMSVAPAL